jgi:Na+-translocating ferredoxin:NAD+ oxidoreductase RnfG subunit
MNKLFKNKLFKQNFIVVTSLLISFGLIILVHIVTAPIITNRKLDAQIALYSTFVSGIKNITELTTSGDFKAVEAIDSEDKVLAIIYEVKEENGHGDFTLVSSINTAGTILNLEFLSYNQTSGSYQTTTESNLKQFIGLKIGTFPSGSDLISGATNSYQSILNAMNRIINFHQTLDFKIDDPFSVNVDGFNRIVGDVEFNENDTVISKQNILNTNNEVIAYIYTLYGVGVYSDGDEPKSIQFHVVTNISFDILNIVVFDTEYLHSKGAFYSRIKTYLSGFIGKNLKQEDIVYDIDWSAGATSGNSKILVDELMKSLQEVIS